MFTITFEKPDLMFLRLWGFWGQDEMSAFRDAIRSSLPVRASPDSFDMLVDLFDYPPQSTAIVTAQQAVIEEIQAAGLRRGATVLGSVLMRMQVERVNSWKQRRYFTDMGEARTWLAQPFAV